MKFRIVSGVGLVAGLVCALIAVRCLFFYREISPDPWAAFHVLMAIMLGSASIVAIFHSVRKTED